MRAPLRVVSAKNEVDHRRHPLRPCAGLTAALTVMNVAKREEPGRGPTTHSVDVLLQSVFTDPGHAQEVLRDQSPPAIAGCWPTRIGSTRSDRTHPKIPGSQTLSMRNGFAMRLRANESATEGW